MEKIISHRPIYRLEKGGAVIFPPLLMVNSESFDLDLTIECGKKQAASCIYCRVADSKALGIGRGQLKRLACRGTYLQMYHCQ